MICNLSIQRIEAPDHSLGVRIAWVWKLLIHRRSRVDKLGRVQDGRLWSLPLRFCHLLQFWVGLSASLGFSFHVHKMKMQKTCAWELFWFPNLMPGMLELLSKWGLLFLHMQLKLLDFPVPFLLKKFTSPLPLISCLKNKLSLVQIPSCKPSKPRLLPQTDCRVEKGKDQIWILILLNNWATSLPFLNPVSSSLKKKKRMKYCLTIKVAPGVKWERILVLCLALAYVH